MYPIRIQLLQKVTKWLSNRNRDSFVIVIDPPTESMSRLPGGKPAPPLRSEATRLLGHMGGGQIGQHDSTMTLQLRGKRQQPHQVGLGCGVIWEYRVVQLNFSPEIKVVQIQFERYSLYLV